MGIVEIHTWNSVMEDIERPNRIVWDLDPGPAVTWKQVVKAAGLVRTVLKTLGLTSWVVGYMSSCQSRLHAKWVIILAQRNAKHAATEPLATRS